MLLSIVEELANIIASQNTSLSGGIVCVSTALSVKLHWQRNTHRDNVEDTHDIFVVGGEVKKIKCSGLVVGVVVVVERKEGWRG